MVASRRRARRVLWALAAAGVACSPADPPPNVLLVTFDTTRADHIGAYGSEAAETPTLDRLAREGVVFEMALSPTPITLPSHASLLTGVDPTAHGVRDNGLFALPPEATLVSEVLRQRGWRTGAFVAAYVLDARFGLSQGFEVYRGVTATGFEKRRFERTADRVVDEALAWIRSLPEGDPWFAWLHFYDPHQPYRPPAPWSERLEHPYDGEIAFADSQLGRLLDALRADGRGGHLLTVVTADHGEGLGEHDYWFAHGEYLSDPLVRIPLAIRRPGGPARVREDPASLVDVFPTILALAGVDPAPGYPGRDLLAATAESERPNLYLATLRGSLVPRFGLVSGGYKYVRTLQREGVEETLHALEGTAPAGERKGELIASLRQRLFDFQQGLHRASREAQRKLSEEEKERLRQLGYLVD
jgi:choline-sulfatase